MRESRTNTIFDRMDSTRKTKLVIGGALVLISVAMLPVAERESRIKANHKAAVGAMKTIAAAQTDYVCCGNPNTYATLSELANPVDNGGVSFMDEELGEGKKNGYSFEVGLGAEVYPGSYWAWSAAGWPVGYGETGRMSFYIDDTGMLRGEDIGGTRGNIEMALIKRFR